jgi:hypothetical protein
MFAGRAGATRVDIFVPRIPFYEEAAKRRVRTPIAGRDTWVHSAEVLAVFKMLFLPAEGPRRCRADAAGPRERLRSSVRPRVAPRHARRRRADLEVGRHHGASRVVALGSRVVSCRPELRTLTTLLAARERRRMTDIDEGLTAFGRSSSTRSGGAAPPRRDEGVCACVHRAADRAMARAARWAAPAATGASGVPRAVHWPVAGSGAPLARFFSPPLRSTTPLAVHRAADVLARRRPEPARRGPRRFGSLTDGRSARASPRPCPRSPSLPRTRPRSDSPPRPRS